MITDKHYKKRIKKLQKSITATQSILLSKESDITYFTGFNFLLPEEREAFFFITKKSATLIYTSFSPVNDTDYLNYFTGTYPNQLRGNIKQVVSEEEIKEILIDGSTLFVAEAEAIKKIEDIEVNNLDNQILENIFTIKDKQEIKLIKKACQITQQVYAETKQEITLGITEIEIKDIIDKKFRNNGITNLAFPTIIAFGENAAKPHHQPGNTKLEQDMLVLIDMGGKYQGYCSDMTRTFWFGNKPSKLFIEVEKIIKNSYQLAFEAVKNRKAELKAKDIDNAARVHITNQAYGENFIHTTGHSLGLAIHEQPSISWQNNMIIKPGMIITIEPGIYLDYELGYRHENTILVTKSGADELTN